MKLTAGALFFDLIKIITLILAVILFLDGFFHYFENSLTFAGSVQNFLGRYTCYFRLEFLRDLSNQGSKNVYVWNSLLSGIIFMTIHFLIENLQRNLYERKKK